MGQVYEVLMETSGCCEQLSCTPLETYFLCPICKHLWQDGSGDSKANEMVGQSPGSFLDFHKKVGTEPRFTCNECGQLYRLISANQIPIDVGENHLCKIQAIETNIHDDGMIYRNGDRDNWIGFSTTTDVTGTVLVVRKYSFKGEQRTGRRMESLTVIYPWLLDKLLSVAKAVDGRSSAADA